MDLNALIAEKFNDCSHVAVCANLPYYITSPLVIKLLESRLNIESLTVMVQKEAAERICAEVGTREAGALSVYVSYFAEPEILFEVERDSFVPAPNVDSAVIKLNIRKEPPVYVKDEEGFFTFVKACFAQRRKTLLNSVCNTLKVEKEKVRGTLQTLNINEAVRSEALSMEELADIYNNIF
jgi:16S rRNA (adenine1518-N6/adenine1519-N6)-dimethyltransferase